MKRARKFLAVILSVCMAAGMYVCPAGTKKVQAAVSGDYEYEKLTDTTVSVTAYTGSGKMVTIPQTLDGKQVTKIGDMAFARTSVEEVTIPSGVTAIGTYAFQFCENLKKVTMPERGMLSIGNQAFTQCKSLEEVTLPSDLETIGEYAFENCESLAELVIPATVTDIGKYAFVYCKQLRSVTIPAAVTTIKEHTFMGCTSLSEVSILSSLSAIEGWAFWGCTSLEQFEMPDSLTDIGKFAFEDCRNLQELAFSSSLTNIGEGAFETCTSLTRLTLPSGLTSIPKGLFRECTGLTQISLPEGLTSIGESAFHDCPALVDVFYAGTEKQWDQITIEANNEELQNADIYCEGELLPDPVDDYKYRILDDGTVEITEYTGSDPVVYVPDMIHDRLVTAIGSEAFVTSSNLEEITIPYSVTKMGDVDKTGLLGSFGACAGLKEIHVEDENKNYSSGQGVLFNKEKTVLIRHPQAKKGEYVIPSSVTEIAHGAFEDCYDLSKVTVPDCVERIGNGAFSNCRQLSGMILPQSVKEIEDLAFSFCESLTEITIPPKMTEIKSCCFSECLNLAAVTLPDSLKRVEEAAFYGCSGLKDVYYAGVQAEWEKIFIDDTPFQHEEVSANAPLVSAVIHFRDGTTLNGPQEEFPEEPVIRDTKQELENLKHGDALGLTKDFQHYLSGEQTDMMETCIYTWLAKINHAYRYSGSDGIRELIMKKAGIDPQGDAASGTERAVTHVSVETKYGPKTFEITLNLGKPDADGNLYPAYGAMHYEILEKENIPSDLPESGQIGKTAYTDLGAFADCVSRASEETLHSTYQWQSLDDGMAAAILMDKTVTEIIGNANGSFSEGTFVIYAKPLFTYSKKVTISCPVDVYVYSMDGKEAGAVINNQPSGGNAGVRFDVNGDVKTVYLAGNDYYLNLRGTDTGTMKYEVEEIANDKVRRNVQFLELQLKKDMQYEGYVFRPLNIDRDLYALRTTGGTDQKIFYADADRQYETLSVFKRIQELSLSRQNTSLDRNKTMQLHADLLPLDASNPNLQWTTDSESVAKVDHSGLVTAVGAGRATVMVSTKDGSFLKQYCVIDVADQSSVTGGSSGGSSSGGGGSGGGSSGWYGGGTSVPVEQEKQPVVVNLHYVLQFQTNGGTNLSRKTMTLLADDSPGIMPKVQRKDYLFDGWYTKQEGGERVTGEQPLKEAATLYARWTKAQAPAKSAVAALKSKKKGQIQVSFQNINKVSGYQIAYASDKKFTSEKVTEAGAAAKSKTISGLKAGKKYYVRVRAYCLDSMKNRIYGDYSTVKSVKVKS